MKRLLAVAAVAVWTSGAVLTACSSSSSSTGGSEDAGGAHDGTASSESGGGHDGAAQDAQSFPDASSGGDGALGNDGGQGGDSAAEDAAETGLGADSGGDGDGGSSAETGAGDAASNEGGLLDCGSSPTLHEDEAGSIFCGFNGTADLTCGVGQECCLGGALGGGTFAAQECATRGTVCPNAAAPDAGAPAIPIACAQIADCTANGATSAVACCLQGATPPAIPAGCSYPKATEGTAVVCESSDAGANGAQPCAQGEVQICSSQADCPTGTTCMPGKWKIFQVGFCM